MEEPLGRTPKLCPSPSLLPSLGPHPSTSCSCCTHRAGGPLGAQCFLLHGSRDHVPLSKGPYKGQAVEMASSAPSAWGCLPSGATSDFVQRLKRPLRACVRAREQARTCWRKCILAQDSGHHTFICFEAMLESSRKARGSTQLSPAWAHVFFYCNKQCLNVSRFLFLWVLFIQKACNLGARPFPVLVTIDSVETGPAVGLWARSLACLFHSLPRRPRCPLLQPGQDGKLGPFPCLPPNSTEAPDSQ